MSTKSGMKRRTRITLALAALTTFAFGVTYGLVAQQGVPPQPTTVAASQSVSQSSSAPAQNSGSGVAPSNSASSQRAAAPAPHAMTRAT